VSRKKSWRLINKRNGPAIFQNGACFLCFLLSPKRLSVRLKAINAFKRVQARRVRLETEHLDLLAAFRANPSAGATIRISGAVLRPRLIVEIHVFLPIFILFFALCPHTKQRVLIILAQGALAVWCGGLLFTHNTNL